MRYKPEQYDAIVRRLVEGGTSGGEHVPGNPNMLVPYFLMASYAYYDLDAPFLTDGCYEWICKELDAKWASVEHWHKHLIDRRCLKAGSGFDMSWTELPSRIKNAAKHIVTCEAVRNKFVSPTKLPSPDISDLLGTLAVAKKQVAKVTGIDDLLAAPKAPSRSSITDLL